MRPETCRNPAAVCRSVLSPSLFFDNLQPAALHFIYLLSFLFACVHSLKQNCPPTPRSLFCSTLLFFSVSSSSHCSCCQLYSLPLLSLLMAFSIAITLCCLHKLVNHWHRRNQFFLHYRHCPLQFSNTSRTLKELLNYILVYPLHPACPKYIGDGGRGTECGEKSRMSG